jgi:hypothetical protein
MPNGRSGANLKPEDELFALLDQLDRLEELIEDMDELGVDSREQAEARVASLNTQVDALSEEDSSA